MNLQSRSTITVERPSVRNGSETRLHGHWLVIARLAWVVLVALALGLFAASMPAYYGALHVISAPNGSGLGPTADQLRQLQAEGLSLDFYAWYTVLSWIIPLFVYAVVGIVIFLHRSNDRMALLASFVLVSFPVGLQSNGAVRALPSAWELPANCIEFFIAIAIALFFYVFPDGRFLPRWTRWLMVVNIFFWFLDAFFPTSSIIQSLPGNLLFPALIVSFVVAQIYRYRRVSTPMQRQQTKWVVFGIAITFGGFIIIIYVFYFLLPLFFPVTFLVSNFIGGAFTTFALLFFPISVGIAILRSRLWEIDRLISRTLVYGTLTIILGLVYAGLVIGVQALLRGFISQTNDVAIVISTLAIAALFQPLRRRIQALIDRRFYRRKYDAARTLEAFSATLRSEVDLNELREHLLAVVQETMQPTHVSLWLRPSGERSRSKVPGGQPAAEEGAGG